jgi:RluA family pseudouridine synthase
MAGQSIPGQRFLPPGMKVIHLEKSFLVVEKPAGLLTMGTEQEAERTAYWALNDWVRKGNAKSRERVFIVHRLDRETSGLLVFARDETSKHLLQDGWDRVTKHYLAVVAGRLPATGAFRSLLAENKAHHVYSTQDTSVGRPCVTGYRVLREHGGHSLLDLELVTGRKHQIRVHLSDAGHPVCGDRRYGGPPHARLALHAQCLELPHPYTGVPMRFTARAPVGFSSLVGPLGADDLLGWGLG